MSEYNNFQSFFVRFFNVEFVRFGVVGLVATAIHYAVYYFLQCFVNVNLSYTLGYLISFCFNFALSARFTFKTNATAKRGVGFALSHLINYGIQITVLNLVLWIGLPQNIAPLPVYLICIPVNFLLVRFVFKKI